MAELKSVGGQINETVSAINNQNETIHRQTETIHHTQLEMGRYYAGLERANDDIQEIRDNNRTILSRLDNAVSTERFEELENHVKTLNGTDAKFSLLGIDINDPKSVEEWRETLINARSSRRDRVAIRTRIMQAVAVAVALALCAAAWNGVKDDLLLSEHKQEQER